MEDKKVKHLFLAIQKDDFEKFSKELNLLEQDWNNEAKLQPPLSSSPSFINCVVRKNSGDSACHIAARHGSIIILRYLIEEKMADIEIKNHDRKTPLHDASQFSHLDCVQFLIEKGADTNAIKKADWSPLMLACTKTNIDVIQTLLNHKANPFFRNKDGWNSFHVAAREGNMPILQLLVNFVSQSKSRPEAVRELCDSRSRNGRKPIHTAALHGHIEVVKFLIDNKLNDVNEVDNCCDTPLMDACRSGSNDLVDLLIKLGANILVHNKEGYNILHVASEAGTCNVVRNLVLNHKLDINCPTANGKLTALQIAQKEKQFKTVETIKDLLSLPTST